MIHYFILSKTLFTLMLLIGLAGCGNTGDLYLPDDTPVTQGNNTDITES